MLISSATKVTGCLLVKSVAEKLNYSVQVTTVIFFTAASCVEFNSSMVISRFTVFSVQSQVIKNYTLWSTHKLL